jgi:hypothetical protein
MCVETEPSMWVLGKCSTTELYHQQEYYVLNEIVGLHSDHQNLLIRKKIQPDLYTSWQKGIVLKNKTKTELE